jgi:uncharacterized repeat protein (TIGR03803 family)
MTNYQACRLLVSNDPHRLVGVNAAPSAGGKICSALSPRALRLLWLVGAAAALGIGAAQAQTTYTESVLYAFTGGADGANPAAYAASGVVRDSAGNLYGTTSNGGQGYGVVFKLDTSGKETVLHSFTGGIDGAYPAGGVILDSKGNLYGTAAAGGTAGAGVVFKVNKAGKETVLYAFRGGDDGGNPDAGVIRDSAGNLYGTTQTYGAYNVGVVYMLDTAGDETVLHTFTGGLDGARPYASVIRDSAGNLYGTTQYGGKLGYGVVYKLDSAGHETVLHTFTDGKVGGYPSAVTRDAAGNLYGTAGNGGTANVGVVYKLSKAGKETVLYNFTCGGGGCYPASGVMLDSAGNLYGTTTLGGGGSGVVYRLDPSGLETMLYSFEGGADGSIPYTGVISDTAGNLYGTTYYGGGANAGVVYKLTPQTAVQ